MSLDYHTLQAIAPELLPTRERYCPECGQSLVPSPVAIDKPSSRSSWWVLMVAGFFLLVASGLHVVNDSQLVDHPQLLRHATGLIYVEDGGPVDQLLPYAVAQLNRDLVVAATGLVLVLLAFGIGPRQRLTRDHPGQIGVQRVSLGVWGAGEALIVALFRGSLLLYGYLFCSELIASETLSLELMDRTVSRTVDVIVLVAQLVGAGYPRL